MRAVNMKILKVSYYWNSGIKIPANVYSHPSLEC